MNINNIIYCDLDGVFADWEWGVQNLLGLRHITIENYHVDKNIYSEIYYNSIKQYQQNPYKGFWQDLPLTSDALELWSFVSRYPNIFLSAVGLESFNAARQKINWVYSNFGLNSNIITVERTKEKYKYAAPNRILIDDQERALAGWIENGGIGVLHKNAKSTIETLKLLR